LCGGFSFPLSHLVSQYLSQFSRFHPAIIPSAQIDDPFADLLEIVG